MWEIRVDNLERKTVRALISEHLAHMYRQSPPESVHALDLSLLRQPGITVFTAWDGELLGGMAALLRLDATNAELKSMRTTEQARGRGAGRALLRALIDIARAERMTSLWLETGVEEGFLPAKTLYASEGFESCAPFADYVADPNSVFMTKRL